MVSIGDLTIEDSLFAIDAEEAQISTNRYMPALETRLFISSRNLNRDPIQQEFSGY